MPRFIRRTPVALLAVLTGVVAGCSSPKPAFEKEDFAQSDTYSRTVSAGSAAACDAGRRALLSQGYNIDRFESARVTGHKNFQAEDGQHTQISFNIECAADSGSNERATVFANAVQDRYSIKRTANSASVGVSVLGQVSMPFGASDDSLVKTASQTVARPQFYDGFFQLLQRFLPDAQAASTPQPSPASRAKAPPKPAPAEPAESPDAPADTLNPAAAAGPAASGGKNAPANAAKDAPADAGKDAPAGSPPPAAAPTATPANAGAGAAAPSSSPAAAPSSVPAAAPATPEAAR